MTWKILDVDQWPEPGSYIYCNKCGLKNRGDPGWIYRDDPENGLVRDLRNQIAFVNSKFSILTMGMGMGNIARNFYYCPDCRKEELIMLPKKEKVVKEKVVKEKKEKVVKEKVVKEKKEKVVKEKIVKEKKEKVVKEKIK